MLPFGLSRAHSREAINVEALIWDIAVQWFTLIIVFDLHGYSIEHGYSIDGYSIGDYSLRTVISFARLFASHGYSLHTVTITRLLAWTRLFHGDYSCGSSHWYLTILTALHHSTKLTWKSGSTAPGESKNGQQYKIFKIPKNQSVTTEMSARL